MVGKGKANVTLHGLPLQVAYAGCNAVKLRGLYVGWLVN